jgi:hypothetical protein
MGLSLCPLSGVKRTWAEHHCDVCFWPKANSSSIFPGQCPLLAQSGNWASRNGSRLNRYDWFVLSLWGRQCDDAISSIELLVLLPSGPSRRVRSSSSTCGASACSWAQQSRPTSRPVLRCSRKSFISWVGSMAAMCGLKSDGLAVILWTLAKTLKNWSRFRRTLSWQTANSRCKRYCKRHAPCLGNRGG